MPFILVVILVALLFCRNSMFELVVVCVRAGLKKKAGGRGGRSPRCGGGLGEPPPFANVLAFPPRKSFEKEIAEYS